MPLYNVTVTLETQIVVVAEDEDHAYQIAQENTREAIDNDRPDPDVGDRMLRCNKPHRHSNSRRKTPCRCGGLPGAGRARRGQARRPALESRLQRHRRAHRHGDSIGRR